MAFTILNVGVKVNAIPTMIQVTINFRIHPVQTVREILELLKNIVCDDCIHFHMLCAFDSCSSAPLTTRPWATSHSTSQAICIPRSPYCPPGTCIENTDSRHYMNLTTGILPSTSSFSSIKGTMRKSQFKRTRHR